MWSSGFKGTKILPLFSFYSQQIKQLLNLLSILLLKSLDLLTEGSEILPSGFWTSFICILTILTAIFLLSER